MKAPRSSPNPFRRAALASLALLLLSGGFARAQEAPAFDAANRLYENGKFADAKTAYERLAGSGPWSANLFYNLGNAEWKLKQPGWAALDYERALALEPGHAEARANLDFVRSQAGSKIVPRPWWAEALAALPPTAATILAAVCGWVILFSMAALLLRRGPSSSAAPGAFLCLALLAGAYAGGSLWISAREAGRAVVVAPSAQARLAPADAAPVADVLPAGTEVLSPEERGPWTYGILPGGVRAWVATDALQRVALAHP